MVLGALAASGAAAQQLELDRDLLSGLVKPDPVELAPLVIGAPAPPSRSLTFRLRSSAASSTAGDSKRDQVPLELSWQLAAESPWVLRLATTGLTIQRPDGQPSAGGWTDTQLMLQYATAPTTRVFARVTVPAHGQLGSSEPEQAVRLSHWRKTHEGRQTWTGLLTASHQTQAAAGVSALLHAATLQWQLAEDEGRSWTVTLSASRRQGTASRTEASGTYALPISFGSTNDADKWTLELALGRSKAGAVKTSSAVVTLSRAVRL